MTYREPDLLTADEVAARLNVKLRRVRGWERRGFLTAIRTARGERRYLTAEVDQLAARNGR
ncbi:MerR family transcriptional regulator [Streptomyces hygroscopicus subsp. hygroscopicus]|nr:MerR family transcriptional regulator [Streptomyces hygroscopicus subsp. hygroscopicus]